MERPKGYAPEDISAAFPHSNEHSPLATIHNQLIDILATQEARVVEYDPTRIGGLKGGDLFVAVTAVDEPVSAIVNFPLRNSFNGSQDLRVIWRDGEGRYGKVLFNNASALSEAYTSTAGESLVTSPTGTRWEEGGGIGYSFFGRNAPNGELERIARILSGRRSDGAVPV